MGTAVAVSLRQLGFLVISADCSQWRINEFKTGHPCFFLPSPPSPLLSSLPLSPQVGLFKSSYKGLGSALSSPSGVWGRAPAEIEFGAFQS